MRERRYRRTQTASDCQLWVHEQEESVIFYIARNRHTVTLKLLQISAAQKIVEAAEQSNDKRSHKCYQLACNDNY